MAEHALDQDGSAGLLERWRQTEPLRLWLYGIAAPLLAVLLGYGLLTDHRMVLWLAALQAILLGAGTEGARQYAVAPATARRAVVSAAADGQEHDPETFCSVARSVLIRYRIPS